MESLNIPTELNYIVNKITKLPINEFVNIYKSIVNSYQEGNYQNINVKSISSQLSLNGQELEDLFGVIFLLNRWYLQYQSHSDKELRNELGEQGTSNSWINNFLNEITDKNVKIYIYNKYMISFQKLNWCIDVSLYNNTVKKTMPPSIIWTITLSDGNQYTIEITNKKFHEIRFNISSLLKEINYLKYNTLRKKNIII